MAPPEPTPPAIASSQPAIDAGRRPGFHKHIPADSRERRSPKAGKTFLALDMALSVASDTACLGRYRVQEPGRALIYLAEDSLEELRERTEALATHRGIALGELDLQVITTSSLRLDSPQDRLRLQRTVELLRPRLLLLDPLVRLHNRNENDATEISELLSYLRSLQRRFEMAVVVVHHARKNASSDGQLGQTLRGSGDLWAWSDSHLYLRRSSKNLILSMEHRAAPAPDPVSLRLATSDETRLHLEVVAGYTEEPKPSERPLSEAILEALTGNGGLTRAELRAQLSVRNERLGKALLSLEKAGRIERQDHGWRLTPGG